MRSGRRLFFLPRLRGRWRSEATTEGGAVGTKYSGVSVLGFFRSPFRHLRPKGLDATFPVNGEGRRQFWILLIFLLAFPAHADPGQDEARAQRLFTEVRCVACQSQDIADSNARIAADMRLAIRREIAAGRTDAEIRQNLAATYGDYVLFRPRVSKSNLILWGLPPLMVLLGAGLLFWMGKRSSKTRDYALSKSEEEKLREIMNPKD